MYLRLFFIYSFLWFIGPSLVLQARPLRLVIVDSAQHDQQVYAPFSKLAESAGFIVAYQSITDIIDRHDNFKSILAADAVFFILSIEFLKSMHHSPIAHTFLRLMGKFAERPKKLMGLFFPSLGSTAFAPAVLAPLWKTLGIVFDEQGALFPAAKDVDTFLRAAMSCINHGILTRSVMYSTSLNLPRIGKSVGILQSDLAKERTGFVALPVVRGAGSITKNDFDLAIKSLLPFGLYWYNPIKKNNLLLSYAELTTFLGVSEHFQLCPTNLVIRYKLYAALQRFLWETRALFEAQRAQPDIYIRGIFPRRINALRAPPIPQGLYVIKPPILKDKKIGAWMELEVFESEVDANKQADKCARQKELIDYILTARLDYLWVSFLPNMYYSVIARYAEKKEKFLHAVAAFTRLLKHAAATQKVKVPEIFVGIEIVNNLVDAHQPKKYAYDVYGNRFVDLPQPLDFSFWYQEVIDPLRLFVLDFKKQKIGNGLTLAGVVLDLEMYGRKTTGSYLSTMVGADYSLDALLQDGARRRFAAFMTQAVSLGKKLKAKIQGILPGAIIGCYTPNASLDWFYQGLCKGMSSIQEPLRFLTFNSLYHPYKTMLEDKGIFAEHGTVLMLSKLSSVTDADIFNGLLQYHQGIWLNRFSRLVEPYQKNSWLTVEQTPMNREQKMSFCKRLAAR